MKEPRIGKLVGSVPPGSQDMPKIPSPPNTVTVRIAVAVDSDGSYRAAGWENGKLEGLEAHVLRHMGLKTDAVARWITATLPIPQPPEPTEVAGEVESGD